MTTDTNNQTPNQSSNHKRKHSLSIENGSLTKVNSIDPKLPECNDHCVEETAKACKVSKVFVKKVMTTLFQSVAEEMNTLHLNTIQLPSFGKFTPKASITKMKKETLDKMKEKANSNSLGDSRKEHDVAKAKSKEENKNKRVIKPKK